MRVALLNTPYRELYGPLGSASGRYFPLGLGYLAAVLLRAGHEVTFLDPDAEQLGPREVAARLSSFSPRLAGITFATPGYPAARRLAALVRQAVPGCLTVTGGVHASALPGEVLEESPEFDFAARGEGEHLMLELVRILEEGPPEPAALRKVAGLAFREDGGVRVNPPREPIIQLDDLPFPAREISASWPYRPHAHNRRGKRAFTLITSRGCPHGCAFCASHVALGRRFRTHSPRYVTDEIEALVGRYGADQLIFNDDTFTLDPNRVREICERLLHRNLVVPWFCFARADTVTPDLLGLMKRAGCYSMGFGVETADPSILAAIGKKSTPEEARQAVGWANAEGLKTQCFFVFGSPGESRESIERTIRFAIELKPVLSFFNMMVPYPGTEMFQKLFGDPAARSRIRWEDWVAVGPHAAVSIPGVPSLERAIGRANRRFYLRPAQILRIIRHASSLEEVLGIIQGALGLGTQLLAWAGARRGHAAAA